MKGKPHVDILSQAERGCSTAPCLVFKGSPSVVYYVSFGGSPSLRLGFVFVGGGAAKEPSAGS